MPNIATLLRAEIIRLSNKTARQHTNALRSASALHRRHLSELRKQVIALEKELVRMRRESSSRQMQKTVSANASNVRFVAKGLKTLRARLGLSAEDFGTLVGASAASVFNWEHKKARPLPANVTAIVALREVGKRDAHARLEQLVYSKKSSRG